MSKKRFLLRLNPELYRILEKWAADDLRSVNAQIEFLLTQAAHKADRTKNITDLSQEQSDESGHEV